MAKQDFHYWCNEIRRVYPHSDAAKLITLAEEEEKQHDDAAKACKRPEKKYHVRRSFYDVTGGMREIGKDLYHLYDDFTPHVLNRCGQFFLFPTIRESCQRYGRSLVAEAPSVGITTPSARTPQEWKWGPQDILLTPAKKTVIRQGLALKLIEDGQYAIELSLGRGARRSVRQILRITTGLTDAEFRAYTSTVAGKIDVMMKVRSNRSIGTTIDICSVPRASEPIESHRLQHFI